MPKSRNRRRRASSSQPVANTSALEDDISVIVAGDKVVPQHAEKEMPKLGLTYSRKTGKPVVVVDASVVEDVSQDAGRSSGDRPTYGPDGKFVMKKTPDPTQTDRQSVDEHPSSEEAKSDLRQIANSVALAPAPDESGLQQTLGQLRSLLSRAFDVCRTGWAAAKRFLADRDIHRPQDIGRHLAASQEQLAQVAFTLRIGLGVLFIAGGLNKLSQLLSPATSDAIISSYTSTTGYINEFFMAFLFVPGTALTPWNFLTALSAFELVTGFMLLAGLLVRPIALIYAFLLWSFVIALPVVTTNGVDPGVKTYMAPAMLVQIRDIALSGMMFALYGLGAGIRSVDYRLFGPDAIKPVMTSDVAGLLLRLSMAIVLVVGGLFAGMPNIKTYIEPGLLLVIVALAMLWGGQVTRYAAGSACAVVLVYMLGKIGFDKGVIGNLNAIKRELALFAGVFVLAARDWGQLWTANDLARRLQDGAACAMQNLLRPERVQDRSMEAAE